MTAINSEEERPVMAGDQHGGDRLSDASRSDDSKSVVVVGRLSAEPLDIDDLIASVRRSDCGGLVVFEGIVRTPNGGHEVSALEYEAWEAKVPAQLESMALDVVRDVGLRSALVVHRVGRVSVGDVAVVVVTVAVHREAAFTGASRLIDRVKSEAWIWKKELRRDGEVWIKGCG